MLTTSVFGQSNQLKIPALKMTPGEKSKPQGTLRSDKYYLKKTTMPLTGFQLVGGIV
jgi:hypothetical protein